MGQLFHLYKTNITLLNKHDLRLLLPIKSRNCRRSVCIQGLKLVFLHLKDIVCVLLCRLLLKQNLGEGGNLDTVS